MSDLLAKTTYKMFATCIVCLLSAVTAADIPSNSFVLPTLSVVGGHYDVGFAIGRAFSQQIRARLDGMGEMTHELLPFFNTSAGQAVVGDFRAVHEEKFPGYMQEIYGMADGAGVAQSHLLIMNLRMELVGPHHHHNASPSSITAPAHTNRPRADNGQDYFHNDARGRTAGADGVIDQCSDYMIKSDTACFVCHNEDSADYDRNNTFLLNATVVDAQRGNSSFFAYTYAGDLPSGAFGWNEHRLAFSLNYGSYVFDLVWCI